jgi:hypothetical protein
VTWYAHGFQYNARADAAQGTPQQKIAGHFDLDLE